MPGAINSGSAPASTATTGVPDAKASSVARPNVSRASGGHDDVGVGEQRREVLAVADMSEQ